MQKTLCLALLAAIFAHCKKKEGLKAPNFIPVEASPMARANTAVIDPASNDVAYVGSLPSGMWGVERAGADGKFRWYHIMQPFDQPYSVAADANFNVFVGGVTSRDYTNTRMDAFVMKLDANGDTLWDRHFGGPGDEHGQNIVESGDGGVVLAGTYTETGTTHGLYLLRLKANGDTLWTRKLLYAQNMSLAHLLRTRNGEYVVTGTLSASQSIAWYFRFDGDGKTVWTHTGDKMNSANATIEMADGSLVSCGNSYLHQPGFVLCHRMMPNGSLAWEKFYGAENMQLQALDIRQNADGSMFMTGMINEGFMNHAMLLKIDGEGNNLFSRRVSNNNFSFGVNVLKCNNDDNIVLGNLGDKAFFLRTDNQGNFK